MEDVKYWISEKKLNEIYTSSYWNNIEKEKEKAWWISDGNYNKLITYLNDSGLLEEFNIAVKISGINKNKKNNLEIADLASGTCWTAGILSKFNCVNNVHCVEISKHRLELLAPHTIKAMGGNKDKIKRYVGSFYNLDFKDESIDYIFMSQAFHHADAPIRLLLECNRVLKKDGFLILIGELFIDNKRYFKKVIKYFLKNWIFELDPQRLFPIQEVLGDHRYLLHQYRFMLRHLGFTFDYKYIKQTKSVIYYGKKHTQNNWNYSC